MFSCIYILMLIISDVVPARLRNWKQLLIWHIIVSVFITCFLVFIVSVAAEGPVSGAVIYALFLLILHLLTSASKGIGIYEENEHGRMMFPIYALIAVLSYAAITIVIFLIGSALLY